MSHRTEEQDALLSYMRDLSEDLFSAGWLSSLEFILWSMLLGHEDSSGRELSSFQKRYIHFLSDQAGGWFYWPEEENKACYIPLNKWVEIYEKRTGYDGTPPWAGRF